MVSKIKTGLIKIISQAFRDIRVAGLLGFLVIVLLISWSGVKVIQSNYALQKQIAELKQQNTVQTLTNTNLALQNEYYGSAQYLELSARQNLGLAAPGETELIVPRSVALAHYVNLPSASNTSPSTSVSQPFYERNFTAWIDFYLHRQIPGD